jgi:hypothetical protein
MYNNNLLAPATKEDISNSMDLNFPGNFRFNSPFYCLMSQKELLVLLLHEKRYSTKQNFATFQKIFTDSIFLNPSTSSWLALTRTSSDTDSDIKTKFMSFFVLNLRIWTVSYYVYLQH